MGDGVMKRHPIENKVFCDGTFKEPDDTSKYTVMLFHGINGSTGLPAINHFL